MDARLLLVPGSDPAGRWLGGVQTIVRLPVGQLQLMLTALARLMVFWSRPPAWARTEAAWQDSPGWGAGPAVGDAPAAALTRAAPQALSFAELVCSTVLGPHSRRRGRGLLQEELPPARSTVIGNADRHAVASRRSAGRYRGRFSAAPHSGVGAPSVDPRVERASSAHCLMPQRNLRSGHRFRQPSDASP